MPGHFAKLVVVFLFFATGAAYPKSVRTGRPRVRSRLREDVRR